MQTKLCITYEYELVLVVLTRIVLGFSNIEDKLNLSEYLQENI
jgi:hypothetical protein